MKKLLFLVLTIISLTAFSQSDTRSTTVCGFQNNSAAFQWANYAKLVNAIYNPDETFSYTDVTYKGDSWCYTNYYYCGTAPAPNPTPYKLNGIPLDERRISKCGYSTWQKAKNAGELAQRTTVLAPGESWSSTEWDETCTSNCCYTVVFYCEPLQSLVNIPALPADKFTSCTKYVSTASNGDLFMTPEQAMTAGNAWVASKTDIFADPVTTEQGMCTEPPSCVAYRAVIHYTRAGKCY